MALGITLGLALGLGGAVGCTTTTDEPVASELAAPMAEAKTPESPDPGPADLQIVFVCYDVNGNPIGQPKSPLSVCQSSCPSPNHCVRCVIQNNAIECP